MLVVSLVLAFLVNAVLDATTGIPMALRWTIAILISLVLTWAIQRSPRSQRYRPATGGPGQETS